MGKAALSRKKETHVAFSSPAMDRLIRAGSDSALARDHLAAFYIKANVKPINYFLPVLSPVLPSKILFLLCHKKVRTVEILK